MVSSGLCRADTPCSRYAAHGVHLRPKALNIILAISPRRLPRYFGTKLGERIGAVGKASAEGQRGQWLDAEEAVFTKLKIDRIMLSTVNISPLALPVALL